MSLPVWLPLLALVGVAAVLYAAVTVNSSGTVRSIGWGRAGTFQLCAGTYQQNCVIDGDTIRHEGVKIRLADIDAPETFEPKCASEAELGRRATRRLLVLMNAGPFEVVRSGFRDRDAYGRELRVIERGGRSLGDVLVAEGLARRWDGARRSWCG